MIQFYQRGKQYSDNVIDDLLSFNKSSNWSVTDGLGTGLIASTVFFEGSGSLKMENTSPTKDFTITNTAQSTVIPQNGIYDFSLYLRKTQALSVINGSINIFKNGAPLRVEPFTIGSVDSDDDINNEWISFITNENYSLSKDDIITFTFTIDEDLTSVLSSVVLYVDGVMCYNKDRVQLEAPIYSKSVNIVSDNKLHNLNVFADEAAAVAGGLDSDTIYKTAAGELRIKL